MSSLKDNIFNAIEDGTTVVNATKCHQCEAFVDVQFSEDKINEIVEEIMLLIKEVIDR